MRCDTDQAQARPLTLSRAARPLMARKQTSRKAGSRPRAEAAWKTKSARIAHKSLRAANFVLGQFLLLEMGYIAHSQEQMAIIDFNDCTDVVRGN